MCYYEGLEFNQAATTLPGVRKRYVKEGVRGSWAILLHHGLSSLTTGRALGGPLESGCAVRWDGCPWTALGSRTELFLEAAVCRGVQLCFALPAPLFLRGVMSFHVLSVTYPVFLPVSSRIIFRGAPEHDFVFLKDRNEGPSDKRFHYERALLHLERLLRVTWAGRGGTHASRPHCTPDPSGCLWDRQALVWSLQHLPLPCASAKCPKAHLEIEFGKIYVEIRGSAHKKYI